jgi:hypothetical protein
MFTFCTVDNNNGEMRRWKAYNAYFCCSANILQNFCAATRGSAFCIHWLAFVLDPAAPYLPTLLPSTTYLCCCGIVLFRFALRVLSVVKHIYLVQRRAAALPSCRTSLSACFPPSVERSGLVGLRFTLRVVPLLLQRNVVPFLPLFISLTTPRLPLCSHIHPLPSCRMVDVLSVQPAWFSNWWTFNWMRRFYSGDGRQTACLPCALGAGARCCASHLHLCVRRVMLVVGSEP